MKAILTDVSKGQCSKPNCSNRIIQRHHKGCERMWLAHFARKKRSPSRKDRQRYFAFAERYHLFDSADCCDLCTDHHEEIHAIYIKIIRVAAAKRGVQMSEWSWSQAEKLMKELRGVCDKWLQCETPGIRSRLVTTNEFHKGRP